MTNKTSSSVPSDKTRRFCVRVFVALMFFCMSLDTVPWGILPTDRPKDWLKEITMRTGIWQGQWSMFTPGPVVTNFWMTADLPQPDGSTETWSSPYWLDVGTVEKFYRFRYMNYYARLHLNGNRPAANDFARYLLRTRVDESVQSELAAEERPLQLLSNGLDIVMPSDGSLPPPDELTWLTFSNVIGTSESMP